jgi:hypothetical protein
MKRPAQVKRSPPKRDRARDAALADLREFARQLRAMLAKAKRCHYLPEISAPLAEKVAAAIELMVKSVEDGKRGPTLDRALGLQRGRGAPMKYQGRNFSLACDIYTRRAAMMTWTEIANDLNSKGLADGIDESEVQKIFNRYKDRVLACLAEQISKA